MHLLWWKDAGHFLLISSFVILMWSSSSCLVRSMSQERKNELREEARDMFYHGYRSYMDNVRVFPHVIYWI